MRWPLVARMSRCEMTKRKQFGEPEPDALLLADVERTNDPVDGLRRVDRVERREHEVARFGGRQRDLDRLAVAHLPDENHLRRLPQGRPKRQGKRGRIAVQLALVHGRLLVRMQKLDRILDGDEVLRTRLVDQVDDGRQRGRLARSGRTRDEHQAVLERRHIGQRRGKAQRLERRYARRNHAHHHRVGAALAEDIDAEPGTVGNEIRHVAGAVFLETAHGLQVARDDVARHPTGVLRTQHGDLGQVNDRQLAPLFDLRWPARREHEIADA